MKGGGSESLYPPPADRGISRWLGGHILTGINITLCGAGERKVGFCLSRQRCKCYNINI